MYKSQAGVRLPWKAGVGVGPVLSVGCHPHHHSWAQELGSGAMLQGDDWQERGERGKQRGRLAQGPWPGVLGGGLQHRLGQSPWAPIGHTGCWWSLLRVQDREAQDLFEHLLGTHLGLAWAGG